MKLSAVPLALLVASAAGASPRRFRRNLGGCREAWADDCTDAAPCCPGSRCIQYDPTGLRRCIPDTCPAPCGGCLQEFAQCNLGDDECCDGFTCTDISGDGFGRCLKDPPSCDTWKSDSWTSDSWTSDSWSSDGHPPPTNHPTRHPTKIPTWSSDGHPPTNHPTRHPTKIPTWSHDGHPTRHPTKIPTWSNDGHPTPPPTTNKPTWSHDGHPTPPPTTNKPTWSHDGHPPTNHPTRHPTKIPTWSHDGHPTPPPTTNKPTWSHDGHPPTNHPTRHPTKIPTWSHDGHPPTNHPVGWSSDGHHEPPTNPSACQGRYWADYVSDTCKCDCPFGSDPSCMPAPPPITTYASIPTCCSQGLNWIASAWCESRSEGTYSNKYALDYSTNTCVKDCDPANGAPCASVASSAKLYDTPEICCAKISWKSLSQCLNQ